MLRLHGARLLHEWLLALKRQDGLRGHAGLGLVQGSVSGVAVICEVDDVFQEDGIISSGKTVFMLRSLDPINYLDREAAGEEETNRGMVMVTMDQNDSFNK